MSEWGRVAVESSFGTLSQLSVTPMYHYTVTFKLNSSYTLMKISYLFHYINEVWRRGGNSVGHSSAGGAKDSTLDIS